MTGKPQLLYLAHRIPYPPNKGDKIRTFNEIRFLSGYFTIDLVALVDDPDDFQYKGRLKAYCRSVYLFGLNRKRAAVKGILSLISGASISQGYFSHGLARHKVRGLLSSLPYRAVVCFSSPTAGWLEAELTGPGARTIMDFCDVDSEKWRQYSSGCRGPMKLIYGLEARRLRRYEIDLSRRFDASVFVSRAERDLFKRITPHKDRVYAVSNGVDFEYFSPEAGENGDASADTRQTRRPMVLMFPGAMDYQANVHAVSWFCRQVMPQLLSRFEEEGIRVRLDIVGKNPTPEVRALAQTDRVRVTGFVKDIRPYYQRADAVVIPLQVARGIQNKVLEAMAMARPVVATPQAVEGIGAAEDRHFQAAVTVEQFVEAIIGLGRNPEYGRQMGRRARFFVEEQFSWDGCLSPLLRIINGTA